MNHSIKPGQTWLDTNGQRIQAHGGCVIYVDMPKIYWLDEWTIEEISSGIHH